MSEEWREGKLSLEGAGFLLSTSLNPVLPLAAVTKTPQTGWPETTNVIFCSPGAWDVQPPTEHRHTDSVSAEGPVPGSETAVLSRCPLQAQGREQGAFQGLFYKGH